MIEAKHRGETSVTLWGDGSPTREFLFVEDCAEALWLAAQHYDGGEPVNVGTGDEIKIRDLARLIADTVEFTGDLVWDINKPNGQPRRHLDVERAAESFGFRAQTSLAEGIHRTVAWANTRIPSLDVSLPT